MPYYLFRATIASKDRRGKYTGYKNKEAIRLESNADIDSVWRTYHKKFTDHYGYTMTDFSVVMLSKFDPRVINFLRRTNKNPEEEWWTIVRGGKSSDERRS